MDEETPNTPETPETTHAAGDDPTPAEAAPAQPSADTPIPKPASKVLTIPTARMGEIKKAERERGRLDVQRQYDDTAKKLGYDSHDDLMAALQEQHTQGTLSRREAEPADYDTDTDVASAPDAPTPRRSRGARQRTPDHEKLLTERRKLNQARAHDKQQRDALKEEMNAQQAEHELRFAAVRAGIGEEADVDFAVNCLRREIKDKTADDLHDFSPEEYFGKKLRKARPYLYGETTREATSSPPPAETGSNGGPPAPFDKNVQTSGGTATVIDAKTLSVQDYEALLRKQGYNLPSVGMPV